MDTNAQAAPAAVAPAASTEPVVASTTQAPVAQAPVVEGQAPAPIAGTEEKPFLLPHGSQAKFKELADGGWKQEDIDAYLGTIEDEGKRNTMRDAIDGKLGVLGEEDPAPEPVDNPFTQEELQALDPVMSGRINFLQQQLLEQMDAVEAARGELPPQMQRILMDPVVKARMEEVASGTPFVPSVLATDVILPEAERLVQAGDVASLHQLLKDVVEAVPEVILQQRAELGRAFEEQKAQAAEEARVNTYLRSEFSTIENLPEFKSSKPAVVLDAQGREALNPEHPGAAFALHITSLMREQGLTLDLIQKMGGMTQMAYNWLANQKGGYGKIVNDARQQGSTAFADKLRASMNKALAQSTVKPIGTPTGGVVKNLVHGVDVALAISDPRYAQSAMSGLNPGQLIEVAKAMQSA